MKAIILAGGKGTRLGIGEDSQKCMASVGGRPFLAHLYDRLSPHFEIIFALGQGAHEVIDYFNLSSRRGASSYFILTQGQIAAIQHGLLLCKRETRVFVVNGDTLLPAYDYLYADTVLIQEDKGLYRSAGLYLLDPLRAYMTDADLIDSAFVKVHDGPMLEINTKEGLENAKRWFNGRSGDKE